MDIFFHLGNLLFWLVFLGHLTVSVIAVDFLKNLTSALFRDQLNYIEDPRLTKYNDAVFISVHLIAAHTSHSFRLFTGQSYHV